MRSILTLVILLSLAACSGSKTETPGPSLVGSKWSTFSFKSVATGANVYELLRFVSATSVEVYTASEKTKIIGTVDSKPYTYDGTTLTITDNGKAFAGNVQGNTIRIYGKDYFKEP